MSARWHRGLVSGFVRSAEQYPERTALAVEGRAYSYGELANRVSGVAGAVRRQARDTSPFAAVLASRSLTAYAGILGVSAAGQGYVPLHPAQPASRTRMIMDQSGADVLIVGAEGLDVLRDILPDVGRPLVCIAPNFNWPQSWRDQHPSHQFIGHGELMHEESLSAPNVQGSDFAYLLFTSGSTGMPKGVPITHANAAAYLEYMCDRLAVVPSDRVSQMSDITFDVSMHDMFVCWQRGACLCVIPAATRFAPAEYIREQEITVWTSVPTVAVLLKQMRMLTPNAFPSLRVSIFSGEALPATIAEAWAQAAPNSIVENHYGPTEGTVHVSAYRWNRGTDPATCTNGIVPIGRMFPGQESCLIDAAGNPVAQGELGELCISGPQVATGYWQDLDLNARRFIQIDGRGPQQWYRTGDLAKEDMQGILHYMGRVDDQVQIRGYRVELQEVDAVLQEAAGTEMVATVAWPGAEIHGEELIGFVEAVPGVDVAAIMERCKRRLPDYMIPRAVHIIPKMPLNVNGKIDRKQVAEEFKQRHA